MNPTKFKEILTNVKAVTEGMGVDANMILDCGTRIYNAEMINAERGPSKGGSPGGDMASEKQIGFLKTLGYIGETAGLTKKAASDQIKNFTGE